MLLGKKTITLETQLRGDVPQRRGWVLGGARRLASLCVLICLALLVVRSQPLHAQGAGSALDFDGVNDVVLVPDDNSLDLTSAFTLEVWVLPRAFDSYHTVLHKSTTGDAVNYWLSTWTDEVSTGFFNRRWREHVTSLSDPLVAGQWYHLVAVFNNSGNRYQIYVNGVLRLSERQNRSPLANSTALEIGDGLAGNSEQFDGRLDEVRVWNRSLTSAEIQGSMHRKISGAESGLVGYWRFDEGSGASAGDLSPFGNTGTLTNMTMGDWVLSTAPVGDASHVGAGNGDLVESADVQVDLSWQTTPGSSALFSAIQINESPLVTTGLSGDIPARYWEMWVTDHNGFVADVTFHYDGLPELVNEGSLKLFIRQDAASTWAEVGSYSVDTEGDAGDGVGSITAPGLGSFSQFIITGTAGPSIGVEVTPEIAQRSHLPTNGSDRNVVFTVTNLGGSTEDFDLLTSTDPGTVISVVSMAGVGVTQGADPDSALVASLPGSGSVDVTVTYSAAMSPPGTVDTLFLQARAVSSPVTLDQGRLELTLLRPEIIVAKGVNPVGASIPGTDLTYAITVTNAGSEEAVDLVSVDSLAAEIELQVGSVSNTLPAGVTVSVEYSDDGGTSWTYLPSSGACGGTAGYDRCVDRMRWSFQTPLASIAPDNLVRFEYVARIR